MELFARVAKVIPEAASFVIGDLMYEGRAGRENILSKYRETYPSLATDFQDEFFWDVVEMKQRLSVAGWEAS